jgi:hypothetical protein
MLKINLLSRYGATRDHCDFKRLDKHRKCIAKCSKNTGNVDCAGVRHETINEYCNRVNVERGLN